MTEEQIFDELMVAKIIAAAESTGSVVQRGAWGPELGADGPIPADGPCCAVGAGCLYRPLSRAEIRATMHAANHRRVFGPALLAVVHGVSLAYGQGISEGFEVRGCATHIETFWYRPSDHPDYIRGVTVGLVVAEYVYGTGSSDADAETPSSPEVPA